MEFLKLAQKRYSCRSLSRQGVKEEWIQKIIAAGLAAPTAVNRQPFRIFWMKSERARNQIRQVTGCTFGADNFLVVGYREDEAWVREYDGMNFASVDAGIAATHMMLEICDLGLESTWVGHFDAPLLRRLCPEMEEYELIAIFPIGFAAPEGVPSPRHSQRKTREEILRIL